MHRTHEPLHATEPSCNMIHWKNCTTHCQSLVIQAARVQPRDGRGSMSSSHCGARSVLAKNARQSLSKTR